MTRPAFSLTVDERTPALAIPSGHDVRLQRFDVGTRVLYAPDDEAAPDAARQVAEAVERSGLADRLRPGMSLVLLVSDPARPALAMTDDVRRVLAEQVLELAAAARVDDVTVLAANGLSRRPTAEELERVLGERVARSFRAVDRLLTHDAEADDLVSLGEADGVPLTVHPALARADLVVDLRVQAELPDPVVLAAEGMADVVVGASGVETVAALRGLGAEPATASALGRLAAEKLPVVSFVAVLGQPQQSGTHAFLSRREWEWRTLDRTAHSLLRRALKLAPQAAARAAYANQSARYQVLGVVVGEPAAAHQEALALLRRTRAVAVERPADVLALGVPHPLPVAPASVTNPMAAVWAVLARGGFAADPRVVRAGGTVVGFHPLTPQFSAREHGASADFFATVAGGSPEEVAAAERRFATDAWLLDLYRHQHGFHPLQPFHLWYACQPALAHAGQVVWVGASREDAAKVGGRAASTWSDALEIARDSVGDHPAVTVVHDPGVVVEDKR